MLEDEKILCPKIYSFKEVRKLLIEQKEQIFEEINALITELGEDCQYGAGNSKYTEIERFRQKVNELRKLKCQRCDRKVKIENVFCERCMRAVFKQGKNDGWDKTFEKELRGESR